MIVRKNKVVPPVTPRIVTADPKRRLLRYGLLSCAFLCTAWFSYEYGRTRAAAGADEPLTQPGELQERFAVLEQEPTESSTGRPDPLGPGVLFLHNDLTPCWRAAVAWALGRIGDRRARSELERFRSGATGLVADEVVYALELCG